MHLESDHLISECYSMSLLKGAKDRNNLFDFDYGNSETISWPKIVETQLLLRFHHTQCDCHESRRFR